MSYFEAVSAQLKDWKKAVLVVVFTVARLIYGFDWLMSGLGKLKWLSDGKPDSAGLISGMVKAVQHSHGLDPLHLNSLLIWAAQHIFLAMPGVTDFLVVFFEIVIGLFAMLGLEMFWTALVAMFLNIQYITAGSANNFGYIWTNLAFLKFAKYVELIGISGYIRFKRGKELL